MYAGGGGNPSTYAGNGNGNGVAAGAGGDVSARANAFLMRQEKHRSNINAATQEISAARYQQYSAMVNLDSGNVAARRGSNPTPRQRRLQRERELRREAMEREREEQERRMLEEAESKRQTRLRNRRSFGKRPSKILEAMHKESLVREEERMDLMKHMKNLEEEKMQLNERIVSLSDKIDEKEAALKDAADAVKLSADRVKSLEADMVHKAKETAEAKEKVHRAEEEKRVKIAEMKVIVKQKDARINKLLEDTGVLRLTVKELHAALKRISLGARDAVDVAASQTRALVEEIERLKRDLKLAKQYKLHTAMEQMTRSSQKEEERLTRLIAHQQAEKTALAELLAKAESERDAARRDVERLTKGDAKLVHELETHRKALEEKRKSVQRMQKETVEKFEKERLEIEERRSHVESQHAKSTIASKRIQEASRALEQQAAALSARGKALEIERQRLDKTRMENLAYQKARIGHLTKTTELHARRKLEMKRKERGRELDAEKRAVQTARFDSTRTSITQQLLSEAGAPPPPPPLPTPSSTSSTMDSHQSDGNGRFRSDAFLAELKGFSNDSQLRHVHAPARSASLPTHDRLLGEIKKVTRNPGAMLKHVENRQSLSGVSTRDKLLMQLQSATGNLNHVESSRKMRNSINPHDKLLGEIQSVARTNKLRHVDESRMHKANTISPRVHMLGEIQTAAADRRRKAGGLNRRMSISAALMQQIHAKPQLRRVDANALDSSHNNHHRKLDTILERRVSVEAAEKVRRAERRHSMLMRDVMRRVSSNEEVNEDEIKKIRDEHRNSMQQIVNAYDIDDTTTSRLKSAHDEHAGIMEKVARAAALDKMSSKLLGDARDKHDEEMRDIVAGTGGDKRKLMSAIQRIEEEHRTGMQTMMDKSKERPVSDIEMEQLHSMHMQAMEEMVARSGVSQASARAIRDIHERHADSLNRIFKLHEVHYSTAHMLAEEQARQHEQTKQVLAVASRENAGSVSSTALNEIESLQQAHSDALLNVLESHQLDKVSRSELQEVHKAHLLSMEQLINKHRLPQRTATTLESIAEKHARTVERIVETHKGNASAAARPRRKNGNRAEMAVSLSGAIMASPIHPGKRPTRKRRPTRKPPTPDGRGGLRFS